MLLLIDTRAQGFRIVARDGNAVREARLRCRGGSVACWSGGVNGVLGILGPLEEAELRGLCGYCHAYKCLLYKCLRMRVRSLRRRIAMNTDASICCGSIGFH